MAARRTRTALEKEAGVLGRPRAFLQAAMTRTATDAAALKRGTFAVGDAVLACCQPGTLVGIHDNGSCTVEFKVGTAYEQVHTRPAPQTRDRTSHDTYVRTNR